MQFLMGLSDAYENLCSNILSQEQLPTVERQKGITMLSTVRIMLLLSIDKEVLLVVKAVVWQVMGRITTRITILVMEEVLLAIKDVTTREQSWTRSVIFDMRLDMSRRHVSRLSGTCPQGSNSGELMAKVQDMHNYRNPPESDDQEAKIPDPTLINEVIKAFQGRMPNGGVGTSRHSFSSMLHSLSSVYTCNIGHCTWVVNSGATDHVSYNRDLYSKIRNLGKPICIGLLDGSTQLVDQYGFVPLSDALVLKDVLYMPNFKHNLLSVSRLLFDA
ncbi:hypothetical protein V2J09_009676 [Rumex salicifolius]